jgi:hypothetical protein
VTSIPFVIILVPLTAVAIGIAVAGWFELKGAIGATAGAAILGVAFVTWAVLRPYSPTKGGEYGHGLSIVYAIDISVVVWGCFTVGALAGLLFRWLLSRS